MCATSYLQRWRGTAVTQSSGSVAKLQRGFLATDAMTMKLGLADNFIEEMEKQGAQSVIYKDILSSPPPWIWCRRPA
ncbi:alcohol dehydrogenase, putative [Leishmania tarentolae]|uniref:Alcohol dehydrogenase, putative n=1 Tax=Leishmania tarentolae TaxID=5689 RepID=A0A640KMI9_LEITA|nr:alcohol dehydrogenase, putative [Leishmania tarentolae]